jgi:glycosyltransferase involved in cell wall biosynthesis
VKLLHVMASVDPRSGGPIEGVRQQAAQLMRWGHAVEVLSLDAPAEPFLAQLAFPVHAIGPSRGHYRYNARLAPWLRDHASDYDAVIVEGLWQYHAFGTWRALQGHATPYYVFTHGMLDPWFKRTYPLKHLKKSLYWPWADYRVLRDARGVIFTCEQERLLARQSFGLYRARERVTAFGTASPPQDRERLSENFFLAHPSLRGKRLVLFLSRLHPKKGCDLLLRAYAKTMGHDSSWQLVMAGPDQAGWQPELAALADELGIADRVSWPGMLEGDMKWGAFHAAEVFALPSHQENFGIVVAEALGCGLPVLISDQVNIWREVEAAGAGRVAPDSVEGCAGLLAGWLSTSDDARAAMRLAARAAFEQHFNVEAMAANLLAILAAPPSDTAAGSSAPRVATVPGEAT